MVAGMIIKPMRGTKPTKELNQFPYLVSPKIDGMRALVKAGTVYSKTMKPLPCKKLHELFGHLHGADAEITVGAPNKEHENDDVFARSRGPITQINGDADFRIYIFDNWSDPQLPAHKRVQYRLKLPVDFRRDVNFVTQFLAETQEDIDYLLNKFLNDGFEGAMLRQYDGLYKYGTSTEKESYLLKLKPLATGDAIILDVIEQQANLNEATTDELGYTKRSSSKEGKVGKGTFGAFLVRCLETGAEFSVGNGPGLTHALRDELWARRHELPGQYITFRYQAIGTKDAPRQPQFLHFRDATDISETAE
jgi:DNA ligase 1